MTTSGTFSYEYSSDVDSVFSLLKDPEFLRRRGEAAGDKNVDIKIEETTDGLHLTIARDRTIEVPAIVKAVVQPTNRAVESTTWRPVAGGYEAEYELEVQGFPGKVKGRSTLRPVAGGCEYESKFEVTAKVPLIGRKIESLLAEGMVEQLQINAQRNAAELGKAG